MKTKLIDKMNATYTKLKSLEQEVATSFKGAKDLERFEKISIGAKVVNLQTINTELFNLIDVFLDVAEGTIDELPEEIKTYYLTVQELKKPVSDADTEEIKKFKEIINTYKQNGN